MTTAAAPSKTNGKSKGNSFERKIANTLSDRFKEFLGQDKGFRRNPDSGSFFGGANKARVRTHNTEHAAFGDLICPSAFRFSIECKHYKSAPAFSAVVSGKVAQWDKWIGQAEQDSAQSNRNFLLIIKYNNVEEFAFFDRELPTLQQCLRYKDKYGYRLVDVLTLPNEFFFGESNASS